MSSNSPPQHEFFYHLIFKFKIQILNENALIKTQTQNCVKSSIGHKTDQETTIEIEHFFKIEKVKVQASQKPVQIDHSHVT